MMPLGVILFLLLSTVANPQQSGTSSPEDVSKLHQEPPISCRYGRLLGLDGGSPIGSTQIYVREMKRTFPYAPLSVLSVEPGKAIAKLRVDQNGYFKFASLKQGDYYFELSTPEGKATSVVRLSEISREKRCAVEFQVTHVEGGLILTKRSL
jgi:hypothetical protein